MATIYSTPDPDLEDQHVLAEVHHLHGALADLLREPRRWHRLLRRTAVARAIQGSTTIEGYAVGDEDALAAVDDEPPLTADGPTWAEVLGYRRVLRFIHTVATEPGFVIDESVLRSMHFMLLEHELAKAPGRYRTHEVYVRDEVHGVDVYAAPAADAIPRAMRALTERLASREDPLVRAAMAHLDLVTIQPFRDGNGRMARALQTMVLAGDRRVDPTICGIEEWLGHHDQDYYDALAAPGHGGLGDDARLWVKFNLRAHHLQAQTLHRRFEEAETQWWHLDSLIEKHRLPDRVGSALFDALLGYRITRPSYIKLTGLDERTATRDLVAATEHGLLEPRGERRGRHYVAGGPLRRIRDDLRAVRRPLADPYPTLSAEVRRALA